VVYGSAESRRQVIRSTHTNSPENELEQFTFCVGENGEDILEANVVKDRVKPLPSRNPKTRVPNWMVARERSVGVEGLSIVENVVNILIRLNPTHLQQTVSECVEIAFSTFGAIQWLPKVANLTLSTIENCLDAGKILESGNILKRLETGGIVDAFHRLWRCRLQDAMIDVLCTLAEFHCVEI
jgi:hypothetical protein